MGDISMNIVTKTPMSWSQLATMVQSGMARFMFDIGSTIEFELKNGRKVVARVVDFDVYREHEVIFCFDKCYWNRRMNRRDTNDGGWVRSEMADLADSIVNQLPDELAEIIKPRVITQVIGGQTYERTSKLWIPSIVEVGYNKLNERAKRIYDAIEPNNKQFEWFKNGYNRVKPILLEDGTEENCVYWWERSPNASTSTYFVNVNLTGHPNYDSNASTALGVVLSFSI